MQVTERLDLSFKDTRALHKKIDTLPDRAGPWHTKVLSFSDTPEEFMFRYRNSLDAVKTLLGDPALAKDIVYRPKRIFRRQENGQNLRTLHDMWTGDWWWELQVSFVTRLTNLSNLLLEKTSG